MFVEERHRRILDRLRDQGKVTVEELAGDFSVSSPTVRADLAVLESRNLLRRTHGGALALITSMYEPPYAERAVAQSAEKCRIGKAAAALVQSGETVIIDAGTTTHEVGLAIAASGKTDITIITNNLPTAVALMDTPELTIIVVGGQAQGRRRATLGPLATEFFQPMRADRLFMGVSGVHLERGFTAVDFDAVQVKQAMIRHAGAVIAVADSTKIGQAVFAHVAPLSAVMLLITDAEFSKSEEAAYREGGLSHILSV